MPNKWMPEDWTEFLCEHLEAETYKLGGVVDMGHKRAAVLCGICYKANLMASLEEVAKTADRINRATLVVRAEPHTGKASMKVEVVS